MSFVSLFRVLLWFYGSSLENMVCTTSNDQDNTECAKEIYINDGKGN